MLHLRPMRRARVATHPPGVRSVFDVAAGLVWLV